MLGKRYSSGVELCFGHRICTYAADEQNLTMIGVETSIGLSATDPLISPSFVHGFVMDKLTSTPKTFSRFDTGQFPC